MSLPQASAGNQLHRAGDLLRALDARNALSNVLEVRHCWLVVLLGFEDFAEVLESIIELAFEGVVDLTLRRDVAENRSTLGLEPRDELLLVAADRLRRKRVEIAVRTCKDRDDLLQRRLEEHDLPLEAFQWYLDVRRYGTFPHSGFGMGIERFVAWVCGLRHLRETIPYPRMLNKIYP
ncbi:MAG: hypothetical protein GWO83_00780 [Bacteroidia bacterium]|nr:hypothetical protein [Bacteroidia bacterium]